MMTPHTSQTPRYGQTTPTQHGQFLRPGAPVSRGQPTYRASPFTSGASPRVSMPPAQTAPVRRYSSQEDDEWDRADSAWAKGTTPRGDSAGRSTPRGYVSKFRKTFPVSYFSSPQNSSSNRHEDFVRKTPQYELERPSSRSSVRSSSGRSVRTNASPHSMVLGDDSTPLYDEN